VVSKTYAVVHEWLTPRATGGSELVVQEILQHLEADLYALIDFESSNPNSYLYKRRIGTTFLQHFPGAINGVQKYLPLLPLAIEQLDLHDYDVIVSSFHTVAKGVLARSDQLHVCYCHTPIRFALDLTFDYLNASRMGHGLPGVMTRYILHSLRQWDAIAAHRVDYFIANSQHTARRIWRAYRRSAQVIYPPVNIERFRVQHQKQDFYLTVSRLESYKRVDLIVKAFNQLGLPLVIIGNGSEMKRLRQMAHANITFMGHQPNDVVERYLADAKAFLYASCEDFGISMVEAQACGTPVIAYGAGGALEIVRDIRQGERTATGVLFPEQSEAALIEAVHYFERIQKQFSTECLVTRAGEFRPEVFAQTFLCHLHECEQRYPARVS
jgi:glycosyltransferase involved in cell wall biosynthesis